MKPLNIIGVSGGKDSTATLLLAIDRVGVKNLMAVFADTGNEHPKTYAYLKYLESKLGILITRVKPSFAEQIAAKREFIQKDAREGENEFGESLGWTREAVERALEVLHPTNNPFLDLCLWKGRFPANNARFCTEELKRDVFVQFVDELSERLGRSVIVWQGVRRDESTKRANAPLYDKVRKGFYNFRPLIHHSVKDVFKCIAEHGLDPNPLYKQVGRVGCAPCVYANKSDLRGYFDDPEYGEAMLERVRVWEDLVSRASKGGEAAFFMGKKLSGDDTHTVTFWGRHKIDGIRHWASKVGNFHVADWDVPTSMLNLDKDGHQQLTLMVSEDDEDTMMCTSSYGLCG
jgi:3'-phosphoadenosine 5'-phosphosulfate sulfotransferase (PAPS reductase)/FAD synthetase